MRADIFVRIAAFLTFAPMMVRAQVNYAVSGNTAYVTNSATASGSVVIAATYNGFPVTSIGYQAFYADNSLTNIVIPSSVTSISDSAFTYCGNLASVIIPDSVTNLGVEAFDGCSTMTNAVIGNGITNISDYAFDSCFALRNIVMPNTVTGIGQQSFAACGVTNLSISGAVKSIGKEAFADCNNLTNVTIPNGVTSIGDEAFYACSALTNAFIPASATNIGDAVFVSCSSLTTITVAPGNPAYSSRNGVFFNKSRSTIIGYPEGSVGSYVIPGSVTNILYDVFELSSHMGSVIVPNTVSSIGAGAFYYCSGLTNLTFLGDAPTLDGPGNWFTQAGYVDNHANFHPATVYYFSDAAGWGPTYGGLPTVQLSSRPVGPQISGSGGNVHLQSGSFGFNVNGANNQTVVVEVCTDVNNWHAIWTNTLSGTNATFTDPQWTNYPGRLYRVRWQ